VDIGRQGNQPLPRGPEHNCYANLGPVLYSIGKTLVNALLFEGSPQNLSSVLQAVDPRESIPTEDKLLILRLSKDQNPSPEYEQILAQNLLAVELVGRSYNKHREGPENMPEPALFEFPLPNDFSFYVWLFQSVCESATPFAAFTPTPSKSKFFDECEPLRISSQLSPTFRHLMRCPQTSTTRNPDDMTTDLFTFAGRTFYKSRKN
ncbi:hypothetical protein T265_12550, partial [Opisthorchis viverrini]